jgi:hypothetical protein
MIIQDGERRAWDRPFDCQMVTRPRQRGRKRSLAYDETAARCDTVTTLLPSASTISGRTRDIAASPASDPHATIGYLSGHPRPTAAVSDARRHACGFAQRHCCQAVVVAFNTRARTRSYARHLIPSQSSAAPRLSPTRRCVGRRCGVIDRTHSGYTGRRLQTRYSGRRPTVPPFAAAATGCRGRRCGIR